MNVFPERGARYSWIKAVFTKRVLTKFVDQRRRSRFRGIPFLLTFDEWWKIWRDSGHWPDRGTRQNQYCMARFGDKGPYSVNNVRITTVGENCAERNKRTHVGNKYWEGRSHSDNTKNKMSVARKLWHQTVGFTEETKEKLKLNLNIGPSENCKRAITKKLKGSKQTPEHIRNVLISRYGKGYVK